MSGEHEGRKRHEALQLADERWERLTALLDARPEGPVHAGAHEEGGRTWTAAEVYAHLARWCVAAIEEVERHRAGQPRRASYDDYEAWNRRWEAEDAGIAYEDARRWAHEAWGGARALFGALRAEEWDRVTLTWEGEALSGHLQEHIEAIEQFERTEGRR